MGLNSFTTYILMKYYIQELLHINESNLNNLNKSVNYLEKQILIKDGLYKTKNDKYPVALRSKLRSLRYIKAFQKANKDDRLGDLIAILYFASSKINISDKDLSGPFIKIQ